MADSNDKLAEAIYEFLRGGPAHFEEVLNRFKEFPYRDVLRSWGKLREEDRLVREMATGKYMTREALTGEKG